MSNLYCDKRCPGNLVTGMSYEDEPYTSFILTLTAGSSSEHFVITEICCIYSDDNFLVNFAYAHNNTYSSTYDDCLMSV